MAEWEVGQKTVNYRAWWVAYGLLSLADLGTTAYVLIVLNGREINPLFAWLMWSVGLLLAVGFLAKMGIFIILGKVRNGSIGKSWYKVRPKIIPIACIITSAVVVWNIGMIVKRIIF